MIKPFLRAFLIGSIFLYYPIYVFAQFPPRAGQPGSTAIFKDSSIFKGWAKTCLTQKGYINISDTSVYYLGSNKASVGVDSDATGFPDGQVISLGDGGSAILTFESPVGNGPGFDFAVFENSFNDDFLELGLVEVSSDGNRFVRFPAISLTQTIYQVATFGTLDATKINNFAGKYRAFYGTPFDLDEIKDSLGINLDHVTHVRIIDVIGCISPPYATFDVQGHIVNDPWPTEFNSCGFDLDAVGVINFSLQSTGEKPDAGGIQFYPNPVKEKLNIVLTRNNAISLKIVGISGKVYRDINQFSRHFMVDLSELPAGLYFGIFSFSDGFVISDKIMKQ